MRSTIPLAVLSAAAVLASPQPVEHVEIVQVREIIHRQFSGLPSMESIDIATLVPTACLPPTTLPAAPTLPSDLSTAFISQTDPCHLPSFTGSQSKEYASYTSALSSYAKSVEPVLKSFMSKFSTACPYATQMASLSMPTALPSLSLANCGNNQPTGTAGGAGGNSPSSGAAAQPTGFVKAAGLLAGVAGLVAAL